MATGGTNDAETSLEAAGAAGLQVLAFLNDGDAGTMGAGSFIFA